MIPWGGAHGGGVTILSSARRGPPKGWAEGRGQRTICIEITLKFSRDLTKTLVYCGDFSYYPVDPFKHEDTRVYCKNEEENSYKV